MKNKSSNRRRRAKRQKPAQKQSQNENFFEAHVQRKCEKCEDQEKEVQKKSDGKTEGKSNSFFGQYMSNISSKGSALSKQKRSFFEGKLNDDFSDVKLHNDTEAATAAKAIGAKAFAYKNHVVLNKAYSKEGSIEEKQLLVHELKHVQQQRKGQHHIQMMPEEEGKAPEKNVSGNAQSLEKEAEQEEERIMTPEAVPDFKTFGKPSMGKAYGTSVTFQGTTTPSYDGGTGATQNLARTPSENCVGCAESDCYHYTGQLNIDYHVGTHVELPDVPEGLTECQHERVKNAIDNILAPHEQEHVAAFRQYNGTVTLALNYTGCSTGFQDYVQQLHNTNEMARRAIAQNASDALDPFHIEVDLDCEDQAPVPAPEKPEE